MTTTDLTDTARPTPRGPSRPQWSRIVDPATFADGVPHDTFEEMRAVGPVVWVDEPPVGPMPAGTGFWAVLGHAETSTVLRSPAVYSSALGLTQLYDAPPPLLAHYRSMMINMDPPEHSRIRRHINLTFTRRAMTRLEDSILGHCAEIVGAVTPVSGVGRCDAARDIVADLPLRTLADMLGMPASDRWLMYDWANRVIGMFDDEYNVSSRFDVRTASPMARAAVEARPQPDASGRMIDPRHPDGMRDLYVYARGLREHLTREPGVDLMSNLLTQGEDVSPEEFENLFWLFCVAGNETVRNAVPGALQALLEHPEQCRRLWAGEVDLDVAVEELLRWWTAVVHFRRTAAVDTTLGGVDIAAGDKVVVFFSAANRDPAVFDDPAALDLSRRPNPHLAFGGGPHYCIGAGLARLQLRSLLATMRWSWSEVRPGGPPVRLRSCFQNGLKRLPVEFVAAGTAPGWGQP